MSNGVGIHNNLVCKMYFIDQVITITSLTTEQKLKDIFSKVCVSVFLCFLVRHRPVFNDSMINRLSVQMENRFWLENHVIYQNHFLLEKRKLRCVFQKHLGQGVTVICKTVLIFKQCTKDD